MPTAKSSRNPRRMNKSESTAITSAPFSLRAILMARHSGVNSSTTLIIRNLRPSWVRSGAGRSALDPGSRGSWLGWGGPHRLDGGGGARLSNRESQTSHRTPAANTSQEKARRSASRAGGSQGIGRALDVGMRPGKILTGLRRHATAEAVEPDRTEREHEYGSSPVAGGQATGLLWPMANSQIDRREGGPSLVRG